MALLLHHVLDISNISLNLLQCALATDTIASVKNAFAYLNLILFAFRKTIIMHINSKFCTKSVLNVFFNNCIKCLIDFSAQSMLMKLQIKNSSELLQHILFKTGTNLLNFDMSTFSFTLKSEFYH